MVREAFRRLALLGVLLIGTIALTGCGTPKSIFDGGSSLVATITNPVTNVQLYQAKNAYAAALAGVVNYRRYCYSKPYAALMADPIAKPICANRRTVILALQDYDDKASAAIAAADNFVKRNPTLSAATVVNAAWAAVADFRNAVAAQAAVPG